jgi:hypothetical protein
MDAKEREERLHELREGAEGGGVVLCATGFAYLSAVGFGLARHWR